MANDRLRAKPAGLPSTEEHRVLMVCLGNICRSPTAVAVLQTLAARARLPVRLHVEGAGTADYHVGEPPDRRSIDHALRRGYDLRALRARQVRSQDFTDFDWILAVDTANLQVLHRRVPAGSRAQLGLLLDHAPGQPLREVPDPYHGGPSDFELVLDLCEAAARGLIASLTEDARARRG